MYFTDLRREDCNQQERMLELYSVLMSLRQLHQTCDLYEQEKCCNDYIARHTNVVKAYKTS